VEWEYKCLVSDPDKVKITDVVKIKHGCSPSSCKWSSNRTTQNKKRTEEKGKRERCSFLTLVMDLEELPLDDANYLPTYCTNNQSEIEDVKAFHRLKGPPESETAKTKQINYAEEHHRRLCLITPKYTD